MFDLPDNEFSVGVRNTSTTPESALFMMNAPFVLEQARHFAQRVQTELAASGGIASNDLRHIGTKDNPKRQEEFDSSRTLRVTTYVNRVYAIAFSRPPTDEERDLGVAFLSRNDASDESLVEYCHAIMGLNEFIYVR